MGVTAAILFLGLFSLTNCSPILDQSGFRDFLVAINDDVPESDGHAVIQSIKDLLTETSEMMYFASMTRFYIKDVTILTPGHWKLDKIGGEARKGEVYEHAAIKITNKDTERGDPPYTMQPGGCMEEGHPVVISYNYLIDLMNERDEMVVKYGPIGKLLTQEFTKYRYGIFEEYGYPGEDGEKYPSTSTQAYRDRDGTWKLTVVNNTCADQKQLGRFLHIEGEGETSQVMEGCDINTDTGEIDSDSCFFAADVQNVALTSMGSYQYTDMVTVFCDDDFFPHNHDVVNKHNDQCLDKTRGFEPMSTWTTILKHTDFEFGHNEGGYVESTVPEFKVYSAARANFVLVLDNSGSMSSCNRMENLKTTLKRWVDNLMVNTKVAIVKFGSNNVCATGSHTFNENCYVRISDINGGEKEKKELRTVIDQMAPDMGGTSMAQALQSAYKIMKAEHDISQGNPGVVMLVTDGMSNGPPPAIDDMTLWKPFQMQRIRVITLCIGHEIETRMKTLVSETGGRAFVSKDCRGTGSDGAFQYASDTYIPSDVGDKAMKDMVTSGPNNVQGVHMINRCKLGNDDKQCFKHDFSIEKSCNKDVKVNMKVTQYGKEIEAKELIEDVVVRRRLTNMTRGLVTHPEVDGFSLSFDAEYPPFADYKHRDAVADQFTEQILDVYMTPKFPDPPTPQAIMDFTKTQVEFKTTCRRNFDDEGDADYYVTCDHPPVMEANKPFKIISSVKRGETDVKGANVFARVHISRASDPNAESDPVFFELKDDGNQTVSGDVTKNDGTYTAQLTPASLHVDDGTGISVMCNLMESPDGKWNDNNFYGRKKGLPTQFKDFTPYCCGTNPQKWNIPKSKDVVKLLRSSMESGAFLEPGLFAKENDFGPPARIVDLKAEKVGEAELGMVKLSWTATGDDWGTGMAETYNLVYSDKRKGLMSSHKITKDSVKLVSGSLAPIPAGERMEIVVKLENFHNPGTYMFAVNATDDAGKVSMPSNVARVNFHDGSTVVFDADPHLVHGHKKNDMAFEDKIRKIVKDERIVDGYKALIEKNKKIVMDAENNVMEKRLKEKIGLNTSAVNKIMEKIKNHDGMRAIYKKKLLY